MNFVLTTDSAADIPRSLAKEAGIGLINYTFDLNGQSLIDDGGQSLSYDDFYKDLEKGGTSKTSAINTAEFIDFFTPYLKEGRDLVHVSLSSALSSTYNQALVAKASLEEAYPQRKIYIIDSLMASCGMALLVDKLKSLRDKAHSAEEAYTWAEDNKFKINGWYTSTDLSHFVRGGRISAPAGWLGGVLNICPIMTIDKEGILGIDRVIRSKKKALKALKDIFFDLAKQDEKVIIVHCMIEETAQALYDDLLKENPDLEGKIRMARIGTTIGSHTGPYAMGIFFWGGEDRK